ncbi:hypothetical protein ACGC1H_005797 [Rhizoctonia solani]|uniref:H-type lectin domain-containing protein n=1 Tax=Rhizoctonia solani TaxID=456999 RepID=A0A8H3GLD2_9AGAM|nr:unnamed protein product [Rhizoctonia solani]
MANHQNLFNTDEVRDWAQPQLQHVKEFPTDSPESTFPLGINYVDYDKSKNIRVKSYFDTVESGDQVATRFSANCHLDTWGDSIMHSAGCTWLPTLNHHDVQSGVEAIKPCGEYFSVNVEFEHEYASKPDVVCWLRGFELGMAGDWRIDVTPTEISAQGCKLQFRVWGTTQAHWIEATWIAYPSDHPDIESGWFDTQEQRVWTIPQHEHEKKITFSKGFDRPPAVYFAISRIDETNEGNLTAKAYVKDVTADGMSAHLDSWGDSVMYTTVGQWIAFRNN